ncbi:MULTISPECIES: DUF2786 domain-containing protein [Nocardiaceae]|uniref:DUF2786 domain-containing protein n=1 Tax=Nocardiaceae TaxID=85025 RepID=UPI000B9B6B98|nr:MULTISPECIES: DUF2786 domain-containing protein [Rhodococcus]MDQ0282899.1 hypothetical protein [Rhodococcus fascians]OZE30751.1 hypothetical protein CH278_17335 [Rhodococcus sp. 05-2254-5]OZE55472.1 hypothetical protein CH269_16120 [Rhodococcus sp. 05-2254-1]
MSAVPELLRQGADASVGKNKSQRIADDIADRLVSMHANELGTLALTNMIGTLYENGWQPLDLMHVVRRQHTVAVTNLAAAALLHHADLIEADSRAPHDWVDQMSAICEQFPTVAARVDATPDFLTAYLVASGKSDYIAASDQWLDVLTLLGQWQTLPRWPQLGAKPSQWPRTRSSVPTTTGSDSPNSKMLAKIRGLLAKADATDFAEEAETLTAKAQELMTRYSIDTLLLAEGHLDVRGRRVHIDGPHAPAKAQLLHVAGTANRVKTIWDAEYAVATLVGAPVDVEQAELVFTSLLVQATRALGHSPEAKKRKKAGSAAFGKAFLYAYAIRIGDRLTDADAHALDEARQESGDLLPILAAQTVAVEAEFDRLFPTAKPMRGPRLDAEGWDSGRAAADRADLSR